MEPYKKTKSLKALIQSATGKAANWNGIVYRAVGTEYANKRDLLSGEGTKRFGGRWTPPGSFATAHASLDVRTAVAESLGTQQQYGIAVAARLPLTLVAIDVSLQKLLDLTDDSILRELDLTRQRLLRCRWRENMDKGREAIRVIHQHGQTFVTWSDIAPGEDGAKCRYSLYRSDRPITAQNLKQAELCYQDILNNSARLFGTAFNIKDRLDPKKPYSVIEEGGKPLPPWSGLPVHTVRKDGKAYYAVLATDEKLSPLSRIVPGKSATIAPLEEKATPIQPIKLYDSKARGIYSPQTSITGQKGLPLRVELHASQGQGGGAGDYGDYYLYFASPDMGYRDGLPDVFSVEERRDKAGNYLLLRVREAIEHPSGVRAMETYWFGYFCVPQYATHPEPRAYLFTERRQEWIIDWVVKKYAADLERVTASGGSMGAWGSTTYALRHPERFAAIFPNRPRTRQRGLPSLVGMPAKGKAVFMDDGKTDYFARMDMVKFAGAHRADLPFFGWCCGRRDGFATWQEQIDMVKAMSEARHGFAFAWNDGDHSSGSQPMAKIVKYYPPERFARNQSYPAFSNSSIDQKLGNGDPKDGDLEGGINLGFVWKNVVDEERRWSVRLSNDLAKEAMTVGVTPRRCQRFRPGAGSEASWTTSNGMSGKIIIDAAGLATIPRVPLRPDAEVVLTITR